MSTSFSLPGVSAEVVVLNGDCRAELASLDPGSVRTCVTSPPYFGLRDYGVAGQIGLEPTPDDYVAELVSVFRLVRDALTEDGTLWLNLGDSYAGSWGAQSRPNGNDLKSTLGGGSMLSARQIAAHPKKESGTGSLKNTPGCKGKDLIGIPWMVAFALRADGWYLRSDIIWHKPNPMPESVEDRPTRSHEYLFLLSKQARYFYDVEAVREAGQEHSGNAGTFARTGSKREAPIVGQAKGTHRPDRDDRVPAGRNKRDVWTIATRPFDGAHFAVMPEALVEPCVLAGSAVGDAVLDPFAGSGTVGAVALRHHRRFVGIEANADYCELIDRRLSAVQPVLA